MTTLVGDSGNNSLVGTPGNDSLAGGGGGDDTLDGGDGNDTIGGATGNSSIDGGLGADSISGGTGNSTLFGSDGNDTIGGGTGNSSIDGGLGADIISGGTGNSTLFGGDGNDSLFAGIGDNRAGGGLGNDTITAGSGNDVLDGGAGDDSLWGGAGNDTLITGTGIDSLDGASGTNTAIIVLSGAAPVNQTAPFQGFASFAGQATVSNVAILNISFGSGNDSFTSGSGDDTLSGGAGDDCLNGGIGTDIALFSGNSSAYAITNFADGHLTVVGPDGADTLYSIYDLQFADLTLHFTPPDSTLTGDGNANTLNGGDGGDLISGLGGNDCLSGNDGNDTLVGGAGADTLDGGAGNDFASYEDATGQLSVSLALSGAQTMFGAGGDVLLNIEGLRGSPFFDVLTGNAGNNTIFGGMGGDQISGGGGHDLLLGEDQDDTLSSSGALASTLDGGDGNDSLSGGAAADFLSGGFGNDTVRANGSNSSVDGGLGDDVVTFGNGSPLFTGDQTINFVAGLAQLIGTISVTNVERISLITGNGNDTLTGGLGNDTLSGGFGQNSVAGNGGDDSISGSASDTLHGDSGNDTLSGGANLDGGAGIDTAFVSLLSAGNQSIAFISGATQTIGGTQLTNIENISMSANSSANTLSGDSGNDTLSSGGQSSLNGGAGDDQLFAASLGDTLDGGLGNDTLAGTGLLTGGNDNDSLRGSGTLHGDAGDDTLDVSQSQQNDLVLGGAGDDSLIGPDDYNHIGMGNDTFDGGPGNDTALIALPAAASVTHYVAFVSGATQTIAGDEYLNIENIVLLGGLGNDTFIGDSGSDSLDGGAGNDSLQGGAGNDTISPGSNNDTIDGGSGTDLLTFLIFNGGVMVNLMTGTVSFSGNSVVSNIENVQGSSFGGGDTIIGDNADNSITDDGSYDFLSGNGGNDTIRGDGSAETILGGGGNDVLANAFINYSGTPLFGNSLSGDAGDDTIDSGGGNDTIAGGPGADQISGGGGLDVFAFATLSEMSGDEIVDFGIGEVLDFSGVAGRHFIGTGPFTGVAGEIRYHWGLGNTILEADVNGDGNADAALTLDSGNFALGETSNGSGKLVDRTDTSPPLLVSTGPADNATNVALSANIVMTFNETVQPGTGALVIHNASDNSAVATISITDTSQVSFAGNSVTINPSADLASASSYYVTLPSGAVTDLSSNPFAGISSPTALNFSTVDVTPPLLSSTSPADNATGVSPAGTISMTFNEAVKAGLGGFHISPTFGGFGSTVSATDSSHVSFSGNTVTINFPMPLASSTAYFVTVDGGAVTDLAGNAYAGIYVSTVFNFTTAANGAPEIAVTGNGANIVDGDATPSGSDFTDFGSTAQGATAIPHTFLVTNSGTSTLTTTGLTLPAGFVLTDGLSGLIAPGTSDTFTVQLDTATAGTYSGDITFVTNDADESTFNFKIAGSVAAVTALETKGTTVLGAALNHFYLRDNTGASPSLKFQGADFVAGQLGAWTPISAERTGNGYEVAWKFGNADQYTVWNTDANGNYVGNAVGAVPGSNPLLQSAEILFQQDLNGDGTIGIPVVPIENHGATTLVTAASQFYLEDNNGAGPSLKFQRANFVAGQSGFGSWTPIGAEKAGNGYEIAWKFGNADQYTLWSTDANGNYLTSLMGAVPGSDSTLQSAETLFQQDLNGDGRIGLPPATPIESNGATKLATAANLFYLQDNNGAGPTLKFQGANFVAGQSGFGSWTPIGAEKTGNGYEIAWKFGNADQYVLWSTDANGNYLTSLIGAVPGSDSTLQSAETLFQQDLNGDGRIGPPPATPIESHGATTLATTGSLFYLQDNTGAGPTLKYQGANFVAGQFGAWTPIGAEASGNGYKIAWKFGSADQYTLWSMDANGNYITNLIGAVAGSDATLQAAETLFQQDLNGNGQIGAPARTPIESNGATTLTTAANLFYLQDGTGAGPLLKYQGANFIAGQFGVWTPIGAEATGTGYEIAWKFGNADQYTLWSMDANGNYITNLIGAVAGSDATLQGAETLFQQDLNGNGQIGVNGNGQNVVPVTTPIESNGATRLGALANLFYLQDSTGAGPVLKYQGANFIAGQFGAWTPIGAEATGNGYEIAWKFGSADQYTLWTMDANGNYLSNVIGAVAGSDATLESAETLFQQDLNADGHFGLI